MISNISALCIQMLQIFLGIFSLKHGIVLEIVNFLQTEVVFRIYVLLNITPLKKFIAKYSTRPTLAVQMPYQI